MTGEDGPMDEPVFPDRKNIPKDPDLARVLGRAKRHWDDLAAHAAVAGPEAKPEWKHYGKRSGWVFVVRGKRVNLMYMVPREKRFGVSFAFGEKAVKAALESDLPADVIKTVRQAKKYPEGCAIRLEVRTAAEAKAAKQLFGIKLAN